MTHYHYKNIFNLPRIRVFLILLGMACVSTSYSQKKAHVKHADKLARGSRGDEKFDRLLGNVVFEQNETTIYCDSAYFFKALNSIEAFGQVRILDGDSVTVTGRYLEYNGNTKRAKLRNNVVFTKLAAATLYTEHLDYDRPKNTAYYFNGGKLVDSTNTLTSQKGYYDVTRNMASFKKEVNVTNPDYTMTSDSLQYNSKTKIIYFRTETNVINKEGETFNYKGGEYDTRAKKTDINQGIGETQDYKIIGKQYALDDIRKIYKVKEDVVMISKEKNVTIYGQRADYYKTKGIAKVYDKAWLAQVTDNQDTIYMTADTLVAIESPDPAKKRLLAYHNVKIFKKDMQGIADSVEYRSIDSTIYLYKKPILWTQGNQMSADSINLLIHHNTIDRIFLNRNAFVIAQDTILNFNQIKGKKMVAEFAGNHINQVLVEGNGESIYFALDEKNISYVGMNKIACSNIIIRFKHGKVNNLSFYVKPDANFIPPHELKPDIRKLKDFSWKQDKRPKRSDVIKSRIPDNSSL